MSSLMLFISRFLFGFGLTVLGSRWAISALRRYFDGQLTGIRFRSAAFYPYEDWSHLPIEPVLKFIFLVLQFGIDFVGNINATGPSSSFPVEPMLWRFSLLLYPCVEVGHFYNPILVTRKVTYLCLIAAASLVGTFLPILSPGGVGASSTQVLLVQQLFSVAIFAFILAAIFEMLHDSSLALALVRAGCTVLIGLWLMTLAVILHPPIRYFTVWSEKNYRCVKDAVLLFGCIVFLSAMYIGWIASQVLESDDGQAVLDDITSDDTKSVPSVRFVTTVHLQNEPQSCS